MSIFPQVLLFQSRLDSAKSRKDNNDAVIIIGHGYGLLPWDTAVIVSSYHRLWIWSWPTFPYDEVGCSTHGIHSSISPCRVPIPVRVVIKGAVLTPLHSETRCSNWTLLQFFCYQERYYAIVPKGPEKTLRSQQQVTDIFIRPVPTMYWVTGILIELSWSLVVLE